MKRENVIGCLQTYFSTRYIFFGAKEQVQGFDTTCLVHE